MRNTFQRCAARIVLTIPLAAFSIAPVSAGSILGTAGAFAILGGAGVAVNGTGSAITGSVGGCCVATAVTGYPAGFTDSGGTVYNTGTLPAGAETSAQADLGTAITALSGLTPVISESTLNGLTLTPGYYSIGALTLTGTLTLNAEGNPNALWVFVESSTLTTASGSNVTVINDGSGTGVGVYWVMGASANLGGTTGPSTFYGNILASTSITVGTGVTDSCGSLLTTTASVTLAGDDTIDAGCQGGGTLNGTTITPNASSVPEPGTFFFVAPALAGLLFLRKRSR
jgi:Ice-binding-like